MTTNRLAKSGTQPHRTAQEWCDHGNAYLWGDRAAEQGKLAGTYIDRRRTDVHWIVRDGQVRIEWRARPRASVSV